MSYLVVMEALLIRGRKLTTYWKTTVISLYPKFQTYVVTISFKEIGPGFCQSTKDIEIILPSNSLMRTTRRWTIRARYQFPLLLLNIMSIKITIYKCLKHPSSIYTFQIWAKISIKSRFSKNRTSCLNYTKVNLVAIVEFTSIKNQLRLFQGIHRQLHHE